MSLYGKVYMDRALYMRRPKAYPEAEYTFPAAHTPTGEPAQPNQGNNDRDDPETREVYLKYALVTGSRHVYTDGSGMTIAEGEVSEPRFDAGMYDVYMPQGGTKEEGDTSFVWLSGRQTVANGELFAIREALSLSPKEVELLLRIFTDSLVTLHFLTKAKDSPWKQVGHENEITLRDMLDSIHGRVNRLGDRIPMSFHKANAHTGVVGNTRADTLA